MEKGSPKLVTDITGKIATREDLKQEAKEWARFLYKLYREHPEIVAIVLEDNQ